MGANDHIEHCIVVLYLYLSQWLMYNNTTANDDDALHSQAMPHHATPQAPADDVRYDNACGDLARLEWVGGRY